MELRELFESLGRVQDFNATKLTASDIAELLKNSGYDEGTEVHSILQAEKLGYFAYAGFYEKSKSHGYQYAWLDDEEEQWVVIEVYIDIPKNGKIDCQYGGMPIHSFDEEGDIKKYFARLKRSVGS